jgi:hypothetical protein
VQSELTLLKAFLSYNTWNKYLGDITANEFPEDLKPIFRTLDSFHKTTPEQELHVLDLAALFFSSYKTNKEFYQGVFDTLEKYTPNEEAVKQLIVSIKRSKVLRELSISAYEVAEGKKPYDDIQKLVQTLSEEDGQSEDEEEDAFITDDLSYLLDSTYKTPGHLARYGAVISVSSSLDQKQAKQHSLRQRFRLWRNNYSQEKLFSGLTTKNKTTK